MPVSHVYLRLALLLLALVLTACSPRAQTTSRTTSSGECETRNERSDRSNACEVRTFALASGPLRIDATPNGGISVRTWDRDEIQIRAEVKAWARSGREAVALLQEAEIEGSVRARLPEPEDDQWVSVSYGVLVPREADVDPRTVNGGITVRDVEGVIRFRAVNGSVSMLGVGGDVSGETVNGGVDVRSPEAQTAGASGADAA